MGGTLLLPATGTVSPLRFIQIARMFIVMAVQTQQLPVTAVLGIVVVVMIAMVKGLTTSGLPNSVSFESS